MDEETKHIREFRNLLKRIKQQIINNTLKGQNTELLKTKVEDKLVELYKLLEPVIFDYKPVSTIQLEELQRVFRNTLETYKRTPTYQTDLEYYLKSDLINNPFTIDIDAIDDSKYLQINKMPDIINNNNNLTLEDDIQ
jgi:hypothetical protein